MSVMRWSLAFVILCTVGCGGGDDDDDDSTGDGGAVDADVLVDAATPFDAGLDGDVPPDAPTGPCNELTNEAPTITAWREAGGAPPATGGSVESGTYYLTSDTFYETLDMELGPEKGTMTISGTTVQMVSSINNGEDIVSTSVFETSGTNEITLMQTCPNELTQAWQFYSAGGEILELHHIDDEEPTTYHRVQEWTRQ